jgi:hypothetical protein
LYNDLLDLVGEMERAGNTGSYISSILKALRSWLAYNDITITRKIRVKGADRAPTLANEQVPTLEQLRDILMSGDKRARVAVILMAHSGVRVEVLGNYMGNDGLRVSDIHDLRIEGKEVTFEQIPAMILVREDLSKSSRQYITFLSEEGCKYLKDYLEARIRKGEKLTKASPIITPSWAKKPFIRTVNVSNIIRKAIRKAGYEWRPYVLRSFFASQLMVAESHGRSLRDYRTFWMGHVGDIEHTYTTNNRQLAPQILEDMRDRYERSQEFLQTTQTDKLSSSYEKKMRRILLRNEGYSDDQIEIRGLLELPEDQFFEAVDAGPRIELKEPEKKQKQKVVHLDEVAGYLNSGWEFVKELSNGSVIIMMR